MSVPQNTYGLWHKKQRRLTAFRFCVEPAQPRFRLAENRNIDASRRTSLSCNQRFFARRDGWARTPSRASWRRGGGRKEPVTGQGSSGIVSGVSEASATEQPTPPCSASRPGAAGRQRRADRGRRQAVLREPRQRRETGKRAVRYIERPVRYIFAASAASSRLHAAARRAPCSRRPTSSPS